MIQRFACLVAVALAALSAPAHAANWPSKPIRIVVPFAAGGAADVWARIIAEHLSGALKQSVVVENRGGGNGIIGSEAAARAPADGYTLVIGYAGPFSINPGLVANLPYDVVKDFTPLTLLAASQNVLVVHPSFQIGRAHV